MRLALKTGGKLFLNGAVIRVDRKVNIDLLNEATFLLESHVLQEADATTPLKQLYFCVQMALIDPASRPRVKPMVATMLGDLERSFAAEDMSRELRKVAHAANEERYFECLRMIRALFPLEAEILEMAR